MPLGDHAVIPSRERVIAAKKVGPEVDPLVKFSSRLELPFKPPLSEIPSTHSHRALNGTSWFSF
jgi:hypothetical protein